MLIDFQEVVAPPRETDYSGEYDTIAEADVYSICARPGENNTFIAQGQVESTLKNATNSQYLYDRHKIRVFYEDGSEAALSHTCGTDMRNYYGTPFIGEYCQFFFSGTLPPINEQKLYEFKLVVEARFTPVGKSEKSKRTTVIAKFQLNSRIPCRHRSNWW